MPNKVLYALLGILGIALIVWFGFLKPAPEPKSDLDLGEDQEQEINFTKTGNLTKNNPGAEEGVWYLVYEETGSPGLSTKLEFTDESDCELFDTQGKCTDLVTDERIGTRVRVEGYKDDDSVEVVSLEEVE